MSSECNYCHALGFADENQSRKNNECHFGKMCCNQGKVMLEQIPPPPDEMLRLWTGDDEDSKFFLANIRALNAQMSFGSLQVNNATVKYGGPASFKVSGMLNRRVGSLTARPENQPKCIQVHFYDGKTQDVTRASTLSTDRKGPTARAQQRRMYEKFLRMFSKLRQFLIQQCQNRYITTFISIKEYIEAESK
ncbi:hypothetical protein THAOC_03493 [Thalassiosira oceanica]|uniref:Uncharacterized protein n=1 Tax=Thalassiosira oceanica TaxID=159749 RepID=K0T7Q8_THAOC|nr:hypothetical protein THAOC_03493 [Thalassiosira oceanica]|eukprot:EJK74808.1 hypothetical protein THAOC_03493 [Thalassiosira oceanica]